MTLTLDLTPEETRRIEGAKAKGIDVLAMLKGVIASLPEVTEPGRNRTAELFAQWAAEDATDDPEELARRDAALEEFKANINANRVLSGEAPVYKVIPPDDFFNFVRQFDGRTLPTRTGKPFTIHVDNNRIAFTPHSTGKTRPSGDYRRILAQYEQCRSLRPQDYANFSVNASYYMTLLEMYLNRS